MGKVRRPGRAKLGGRRDFDLAKGCLPPPAPPADAPAYVHEEYWREQRKRKDRAGGAGPALYHRPFAEALGRGR